MHRAPVLTASPPKSTRPGSHLPVFPDIQRGRRRLGGTGEDIVRDDDGWVLCVVTADTEADLDDEDVRRAMDGLWAAFRLARDRRTPRVTLAQ